MKRVSVVKQKCLYEYDGYDLLPFIETLKTVRRKCGMMGCWVHGIGNACCVDSALRRLSVTKRFAR